jgi:hypothetical protein
MTGPVVAGAMFIGDNFHGPGLNHEWLRKHANSSSKEGVRDMMEKVKPVILEKAQTMGKV